MKRTIVIPLAAVRFRTSRSSGPGGQNVNKLDTRVEAIVNLEELPGLSSEDCARVRHQLRHRLNADGHLCVASQRSRSQWQNRQFALERAAELLTDALRPVAPRVATRPTTASRRRRVESKKRRSALKTGRRRPGRDDD